MDINIKTVKILDSMIEMEETFLDKLNKDLNQLDGFRTLKTKLENLIWELKANKRQIEMMLIEEMKSNVWNVLTDSLAIKKEDIKSSQQSETYFENRSNKIIEDLLDSYRYFKDVRTD